MRTGTPQTPLAAVTSPKFLLTAWPWRSLGYLLTTAPLALAAALPLAVLGLPWIVALFDTAGPRDVGSLGRIVLLTLVGAALIAVFGPLLALPLATVERWRLRLVDPRPATPAHRRPPAPGLWQWVRTRYGEGATWRELGYACLLATVAPVLTGVALMVPVLLVGMIASPFVVAAGSGPMAFGLGQITTVEQAVPYAVGGVVLLPVAGYVLAVVAGAHGAGVRALLHGADREVLQAELVEVSRSRARLVDAFNAERRRIERDLHDGAQRRLVSLTLQLGLAQVDVPADSPAGAALAEAHTQAKQLMAELRELIRGIHPQVLTDRGLPVALRELADEAAVPVTVEADLPERLPDHVESTAYFAVVEALTNVAKHSGATHATVTARRASGTLVVEVTDDGHGGADPQRGTGLIGLADRVAVVDGRMLLSSPPGGPTVVRVELPCSQTEPRSG